MDNDNSLPLKAGKLPKECYLSWQEFLDDAAKVLSLAQDTKEIIKGATGLTGQKGLQGARGPVGATGEGATVATRSYPIPASVRYVDFPVFTGWQNSIYNIQYNGRVDAIAPDTNPFVQANGYVGAGTIVLVDAAPSPTTVRLFLTFSAPAIIATPDANFILNIITIS